jgi:hypothetical protein
LHHDDNPVILLWVYEFKRIATLQITVLSFLCKHEVTIGRIYSLPPRNSVKIYGTGLEDLRMKYAMSVFILYVFPTILPGCEQAQQAIEAVDKARTLADEIQKKAKEIIPEPAKKSPVRKDRESDDTAKHKEKD